MSMRKLIIEGRRYLWGVSHKHHVLPAESPDGVPGCREVFTAYLEGWKATPLRVQFSAAKHHQVGHPAAGEVWVSKAPKVYWNLNTPGIATGLIKHALANGWQPDKQSRPTVIEDGFAFGLTSGCGVVDRAH